MHGWQRHTPRRRGCPPERCPSGGTTIPQAHPLAVGPSPIPAQASSISEEVLHTPLPVSSPCSTHCGGIVAVLQERGLRHRGLWDLPRGHPAAQSYPQESCPQLLLPSDRKCCQRPASLTRAFSFVCRGLSAKQTRAFSCPQGHHRTIWASHPTRFLLSESRKLEWKRSAYSGYGLTCVPLRSRFVGVLTPCTSKCDCN